MIGPLLPSYMQTSLRPFSASFTKLLVERRAMTKRRIASAIGDH